MKNCITFVAMKRKNKDTGEGCSYADNGIG